MFPKSTIFKNKRSSGKTSTKAREIKDLIDNLKGDKCGSDIIEVENFKNNIINLLRFKNRFDTEIFKKLAKEYKETSNIIFEILLSKIESFKEMTKDINTEDSLVSKNIEKIINIIEIFSSIETSVLFEAKSLIFKEFEELTYDIQETTITNECSKRNNM